MSKVRSKKLFLGVKDDRFDNRRQSSIISILTDGNELYLNQYGKMFTDDELGNFDIIKTGQQAVLEFFPLDGRNNEYSYSFISYDTKQNILDYDKYDFGNTVSIATTHSNVSAGSSSIVYRIPSNFSSSKLLIEFSSNFGNSYEYSEINLVTNGTDYYYSQFGRITISDNPLLNQVGIGTFNLIKNGSDLEVIFYSNTSESFDYNTVAVSIANTNFNTTSSRGLRYADVKSVNVSIASSTDPDPTVITSYSSNYNLGYFIVQITDKTNGEAQLSEVVVLSNESNSTIIEYGNVYTNYPLGTFESNSTSLTELIFTPIPDIDVEVTLLHHTVSYIEFSSFPASIDFKNAELSTGLSRFESTDVTFKKDFNLTYNNIPIFERIFNGSQQSTSTNPASVDLNRDLIYIPNHFFTSGEKVEYRSEAFKYLSILSTQTTSVAGIGTNILDVLSTSGLTVSDFFNFDGDYIPISNINSNKVSLSSTISSTINSGVAVTFSRLFESDAESASTVSSIGIAQTYITGVGNTNKLSGELYAYKFDDKFIGFCTSPIDALSSPPKLINLTSVGIGNNHYITATNQNSKAIILIDNVIQAPIVSTAVTAILQSDLELAETTLYFSGITSFFSGDIIKVGDEIMKISSVGVGSTNFIEVQRPLLGSFLTLHDEGELITKLKGNYNIVGNTLYFTDAPYGPIIDSVNGDINIRSTFQGRVFLRSGVPDTNNSAYQENYVFDDISSEFDVVTKSFELKSLEESISGFSTSNSIILVNNIFQNPENDYNLLESSGTTRLNFTGTATSALYDPNNASVPRGGIIVSVGSSNGFGYQPLVSAGGTAIVSIAGTIASISIGNSGSGYRPGVQPLVRVGVQTLSSGTPRIEYIGTASVSNGRVVGVSITNPGLGYTSSNPPLVIFDSPLSYENLSLIHTPSSSGIGSQAKIDIVVGQGSSVIDFTIKNYGYSYNVGDTLTVETGGLSGIPTDTTKPFQPFVVSVERTFTDNFSGWSMGELQKLDDVDSLFNGTRKTFPISDNGNRFAIISKKGSSIDLNAVLLIFINDVLQKPGDAYNFTGGSTIEFTEAPKEGDKCRIMFYKGTPNVDVVDVDILGSIKTGDTLKITSDILSLNQNERLVRDIILPDTVETSPYNSVGITSNLELLRPVIWCKQKNDSVVDGVPVNKNRIEYEPNIFPSSVLIENVGTSSTQIFVDSVKTSFDSDLENTTEAIINKIEIIDNTNVSSAIATAIVSAAGTISSISILSGGVGYTTNPSVSIQSPIGIGTTGISVLRSSISSNSVNSINVVSPGFGYTQTNPPIVLVESPSVKREYITGVNYRGDFGIITGIKTANVGFASTALIFDLYIPQESYLRDSSINNPSITASQLQENYYFVVSNSKVGNGVTSLRKDRSIIGIGTTGIDNVYQIISVSSATTSVYGIGNTTVTQVTVSISSYGGLTGLGFSNYYGDYSWGLIEIPSIRNSFTVNTAYGVVGLNSTPVVRRYNSLRISNYNSI